MLKDFDKVPKFFGRFVKYQYFIIVSERRKKMKLGEKILKLRKKQGLSQEQLGEQVNVTRQTISNWELDETTPNPDQLKLLSKALNISIDELLDNDIKGVLETKINNTEKLSKETISLIKFLAIILFLIIVMILKIIF